MNVSELHYKMYAGKVLRTNFTAVCTVTLVEEVIEHKATQIFVLL